MDFAGLYSVGAHSVMRSSDLDGYVHGDCENATTCWSDNVERCIRNSPFPMTLLRCDASVVVYLSPDYSTIGIITKPADLLLGTVVANLKSPQIAMKAGMVRMIWPFDLLMVFRVAGWYIAREGQWL